MRAALTKVRRATGDTQTIAGWEIAPSVVIANIQDLGKIDGSPLPCELWAVIHAPSGFTVGPTYSHPEAAFESATRLMAITDLDLPSNELDVATIQAFAEQESARGVASDCVPMRPFDLDTQAVSQ